MKSGQEVQQGHCFWAPSFFHWQDVKCCQELCTSEDKGQRSGFSHRADYLWKTWHFGACRKFCRAEARTPCLSAECCYHCTSCTAPGLCGNHLDLYLPATPQDYSNSQMNACWPLGAHLLPDTAVPSRLYKSCPRN